MFLRTKHFSLELPRQFSSLTCGFWWSNLLGSLLAFSIRYRYKRGTGTTSHCQKHRKGDKPERQGCRRGATCCKVSLVESLYCYVCSTLVRPIILYKANMVSTHLPRQTQRLVRLEVLSSFRKYDRGHNSFANQSRLSKTLLHYPTTRIICCDQNESQVSCLHRTTSPWQGDLS
ncbi:hypothetical protein BR93DRAFT_686684 [Coniochaeta sp. PMI_546]|nr:hypothetical protein BR93DRAFT_686684 [Coniochaeta sp. PMI_546]